MNPVTALEISIPDTTLRTGDVLHLRATARNASGRRWRMRR
ncbi:MAG: hypothetical protein R2882_14580 [Gemmatimonadales bacterium]